jgi:hypothetical protein
MAQHAVSKAVAIAQKQVKLPNVAGGKTAAGRLDSTCCQGFSDIQWPKPQAEIRRERIKSLQNLFPRVPTVRNHRLVRLSDTKTTAAASHHITHDHAKRRSDQQLYITTVRLKLGQLSLSVQINGKNRKPLPFTLLEK